MSSWALTGKTAPLLLTQDPDTERDIKWLEVRLMYLLLYHIFLCVWDVFWAFCVFWLFFMGIWVLFETILRLVLSLYNHFSVSLASFFVYAWSFFVSLMPFLSLWNNSVALFFSCICVVICFWSQCVSFFKNIFVSSWSFFGLFWDSFIFFTLSPVTFKLETLTLRIKAQTQQSPGPVPDRAVQ